MTRKKSVSPEKKVHDKRGRPETVVKRTKLPIVESGERRRKPAASEEIEEPSDPFEPILELEDWDEVDEVGWESFPASDPPSR